MGAKTHFTAFCRDKASPQGHGTPRAAAVRRRMVSVHLAHGHPEALHLSGGEDKLPPPCTSTDISSRGRSSSAGTRCAAHQPPPLPLHHPAAKTLLRDAALVVIRGEIIGRAGPREHNPDSCPAPRVPAPFPPREGLSPLVTLPVSHICSWGHQPHPFSAPIKRHPRTHVMLHKIYREQNSRQALSPAGCAGVS